MGSEVGLQLHRKIPEWWNEILCRMYPRVRGVGNMDGHHWFDGIGCVHRVEIDKREVKYRSELLNGGLKAEGGHGNQIWVRQMCVGLFVGGF